MYTCILFAHQTKGSTKFIYKYIHNIHTHNAANCRSHAKGIAAGSDRMSKLRFCPVPDETKVLPVPDETKVLPVPDAFNVCPIQPYKSVYKHRGIMSRVVEFIAFPRPG